MSQNLEPIKYLGSYISGEFVQAKSPETSWQIVSPADLSDEIITIESEKHHALQAVEAARNAFKTWSHVGQNQRFEYLLNLKKAYEKNSERIALAISRETGKPLWEAKTEAKAIIGKIDITLNHSINRVSEGKIENALPNINGYVRYKPRGVMSVVGPFNFPAHLANGHIVPALATGNTVIFKPSDKTPAVGQIMAECFHEAGFPEGVFNLVQGRGDIGQTLVSHEHVDGVLFTGSYDVGLKIKQETLNHHWKILALEMGGKNCTVVWEDADLKKAVYESLIGSFLTTGQRCSGTSKVIIHPSVYDEFLDKFYAAAKKIKIGHWSEDVFMGSLISGESVENYLRFQEIAKREGAECIMRGKAWDGPYKGYYVTPSIYSVDKFDPKSVYQKSEIFGPNVALMKTDDFDHAIEINNSSGFGLAMAVFTQNESLYRKALIDAKVGLLNWNRTTNGASSKLPFGGMGKSGNDRPSADHAVDYTTIPVATLEDKTAFDESKVLPGMDFEW